MVLNLDTIKYLKVVINDGTASKKRKKSRSHSIILNGENENNIT